LKGEWRYPGRGQNVKTLIPIMRVILILVLLAFLPSAAHADKRIALLIGNKDYKAGVGALTNPLNDIRIVEAALKAIGFEVMQPVQNARRADMVLAINDFAAKLKAAGRDAIGFLYYSGHGVASEGENYLVSPCRSASSMARSSPPIHAAYLTFTPFTFVTARKMTCASRPSICCSTRAGTSAACRSSSARRCSPASFIEPAIATCTCLSASTMASGSSQPPR
jgi:Caspase domain